MPELRSSVAVSVAATSVAVEICGSSQPRVVCRKEHQSYPLGVMVRCSSSSLQVIRGIGRVGGSSLA